jgi:hypothetical protein
MTFDECQEELVLIRRKQGTRCPMIRIDHAGTVFRGRLTRADSDPEHRQARQSPYGVLVLQSPGLARGPETVLQIADIHRGAIREIDAN